MIRVLAIAEEFGELLVYERIGRHFCNLDITAVRDRGAALSALQTNVFDVIVVDCESAGFTEDCIEWLRHEESRQSRYTPMIVVVAQDPVLGSLRAFVEDVVKKPFEDRQFYERLQNWANVSPRSRFRRSTRTNTGN